MTTNAGVFKSYAIGEILNTPVSDETPGGVKITRFDLLIRPEIDDEDQSRGTRLHCSAARGASIAAEKQLDVGMLVWVEGRVESLQSEDRHSDCAIVLKVTRFQILTGNADEALPDNTIGSMPTSGDSRNAYSVRNSKERQVVNSPKKLPPKPGKTSWNL